MRRTWKWWRLCLRKKSICGHGEKIKCLTFLKRKVVKNEPQSGRRIIHSVESFESDHLFAKIFSHQREDDVDLEAGQGAGL